MGVVMYCLQFPDTPSSVLSVFDFDPEEIARQMTIIDFSLFARIKPAELLNQVLYVEYIMNTSSLIYILIGPGLAETQVQASSSEHPAISGAYEQPHTMGGHYHPLTEGTVTVQGLGSVRQCVCVCVCLCVCVCVCACVRVCVCVCCRM